MNRIYFIPVLISGILSSLTVSGATWTTQSNGNWSDPFTWGTSLAPAYSTSDTFIINHYVAFHQPINLTAPAYMYIDSAGTLCGNYVFNVHANARVVKYGEFYSDTMNITGGFVDFYPPGHWQVSGIVHLTGPVGAYFHIHGAGGKVGDAFSCQFFEGPPLNINEEDKRNFLVYPNPATGTFHIEASENLPDLIAIYDLTGRLVRSIRIVETNNPFSVNGLGSGSYLLLFLRGNHIMHREKLLIL